MTNAKIALGNVVNADQVFELSTRFFITRNTYGNNIGIACIMQYSVGIMNSTVYRIGVDIRKIGLIL